MSGSETLYDALGGRDAIEAVVDRFYERVVGDDSLAPFFEDVDMDRLRAHQTAFLSAATGGPYEYSGVNMREAHAHLDLTGEDFDAVADHLRETLEEFDVGREQIIELMVTVVELRPDVVGEDAAD